MIIISGLIYYKEMVFGLGLKNTKYYRKKINELNI